MTRDDTIQETIQGETFVQRNRRALEERWQRPITLPSPGASARREAAGRPDLESVQIRTRDGNWVRVHSARDPMREAAAWLDDVAGTSGVPEAVVIIGAGLGFVLDVLEKRSPATRVLLLEPEPELVPFLLGRRDWTEAIAAGRLLVLWGPDFDGAAEAWRVLDGVESPLVLSHPVLVRERPEGTKTAARVLERATNDWKGNQDARKRFAGRYLFNTLRNLPRFETAGDVATMAGRCAGMPAVIAGAGPSLNRNLEALTGLDRARERAVLISVDTALRPCLAAGLAPHFVVAVDPAEVNARHLTNLPPCEETWLVAEPSIDPRAFDEFAGRTLLFRIADHDPWPWIRSKGLDRGLLRVWGSVLTAAVDFALKLGCDPLILIGADLAYTGNQPYCRGTVYEEDWTYALERGYSLEQVWTPWLKEPGYEAPDIHGAPIRTTSYLIAFRDWLADLSTRERRRFLNATGAGVLRGGTFELTTVTEALAKAGQTGVQVPRPPLPHAGRSVKEMAAAGLSFASVFERGLAVGPGTMRPWLALLADKEATDAALSTIDTEINQLHLQELELADPPASPELQREIDALKARLGSVDVADTTLTDEVVTWLASGTWRQWPFVERLRIIGTIATLYLRNRSILIPRISGGLAEIFRSVLTPAQHVGFAAQFYDLLYMLRWVTTEDPNDLIDFRDEVVRPMTQHAREWTAALQIPGRTQIGEPPYRVGYLSRSSRFAVGDAIARVTLSMLRGHHALGSDRFQFYYYGWNGIDDDYRRELDALGVTTRISQWTANPCADTVRLRGTIAEDRIDVLITDSNFGLPTVLFASRVAPIQVFLDMGFATWDVESVDYSFLCFSADPQILGLAPLRTERIDYRYDRPFVETSADAEAIAAQRARFAGASHVFGFVGRLIKLSPDYFRTIQGILEQVPDAVMYLGGVGDTDAVRRAIHAMGPAANRVIFDAGPVDGPLMFRAIDTFLDTFPFFGTLACLQAQAAGRPVVFLADKRAGHGRLQCLMRDHALRASSVADYVARASRLAMSPEDWAARSREAERVVARATDVASMAAQVEDALDRLLATQRSCHD